MKILLAEDDDALRNSFVRQLREWGHEVEAYPNGARLCDAIRAGATGDMVWSDLEMPEGDGFEVMSVAKKYLPKIPLLVVSGHTDADHLLRTLRGGAVNFLPKPFQPPELAEALRRIETMRTADRDKDRAWRSLMRCELWLEVPPELGVAAATAAFLRNHTRAILDELERDGLYMAVLEIMLNAVEHGCLEITREEKLEALRQNRYTELVGERRADPRLSGRLVDVRMAADAERIEVVVSDPGPGFDPSSLPDPSDAENLFHDSGRGITMARVHAGELFYSNGGRTVTLRFSKRKPAA